MGILRDVGVVLGRELQDGEVTAAHRVPSFKQNRTPNIVVQFQTRIQRDAWITSYRKKKSLTAKEVNKNFPSNKIYISEHLSPENKIFLGQLKQKCNELSIKYVWPKDGKFYVRRSDGEKCYKINKLSDIKNVQ